MGVLNLSTKERRRMELLSRVRGGLKLVKVAERSRLSYRQVKRAWKRYWEGGDAGLVHRGRGRDTLGDDRRCDRAGVGAVL